MLPSQQQRELSELGSLVAQDSGSSRSRPLHPSIQVSTGLGVAQVWTSLRGRCGSTRARRSAFTLCTSSLPTLGIAVTIGVNSATDDDKLFDLVLTVYDVARRSPSGCPGGALESAPMGNVARRPL